MAKFESNYCPVNETLKIISGKWHLLIIRDLFFGKKRFKEFKKDKPNLSNKVLTECLKDLESNGLISKTNLDDSKITEYSLTEEGRKMNRILYELAIFTLEKDDSTTDAESEEFIKIFKDTLDID
ncbi:MAG: helix-turn-helix transcriptional regulator [Methanobrevibacter sp.]|uniref:winged helix-turn-helix transcriptional regulator n=1 Tax=Methanobrevibacter sp. TaxID=66852 RepID=UPI00257EA499|nr:helix-turn-helix domain-containing protein [Methanobrevibacter sp.]MBR2665732.1 helix-turn-helix transcriptional regulator [Methanobrevibacter sp.]MBR3140328.1 helix-turn-helix transcriptional regulator [Methanobrevibacter sp.]MBR3197710.1 helix-turn-helix transcriptional regulator [Methanobrevibacter sp.]MBR7051015.1 helix-turn-helix transcriptional regulator [Methanobrevibacter sp.]